MAGTSWLVPKGVIADPTTADGIDSSRSFENGEDAAKALSGDSSLAANYMAVTGNVAASYAVSKTFQRNYQYFLFAHNHVRIHVELDNYQGAVDEELLLRRLRRMNRWDPRSQATIEQYRTLFRTIGTHIIVSADYGGRLQLNTWADNSDSQVNQNFELDVGAQYNGLTTGGKVDVDVKGSSQFSKFQHSLQKLSSCRGGDPKLSARLSANPGAIDVWETFKKWANSADTVPNVMSFQTTLLSDIITNAANDQLAAYGVQVQRAYDYLVENPVHHLTLARMSITSDWGEIGLLTPSAYIRKTEGQADVDGLVYSTTKVTWALGAGLQREKLIEFYISNDGSPVDISLSHGSIGAPGKTGKIEVRFAE
ncbi:MAG: hypothetical protein Q9206_004569, partial [Seirophora lacunosa]